MANVNFCPSSLSCPNNEFMLNLGSYGWQHSSSNSKHSSHDFWLTWPFCMYGFTPSWQVELVSVTHTLYKSVWGLGEGDPLWASLILLCASSESCSMFPLFHSTYRPPLWHKIVCLTPQHSSFLTYIITMFTLCCLSMPASIWPSQWHQTVLPISCTSPRTQNGAQKGISFSLNIWMNKLTTLMHLIRDRRGSNPKTLSIYSIHHLARLWHWLVLKSISAD